LTAKVKKEILKAFKAIHALGVVHGDVRADNILVGKDESVWIIDFEFAAIVEGNQIGAAAASESGEVEYLLNEVKRASSGVGMNGINDIYLGNGVKGIGVKGENA
jgi:RIO-like serine/threonine protein kinase